MGDVADFGNFMGAVIDGASFKTQVEAIEEAKSNAETEIVVGGGYDDSQGYFVEPTVIETRDPDFRLMREEIFGPVVTTYVYDEAKWDETLDAGRQHRAIRADGRGLLGGSRGGDGRAEKLRYAAGNFYVNDKPTGAVVGQQPFGGARASGTNDKAGSMWNLIRWVSPAHDQGDVRPADELPLSVPRHEPGQPGYLSRRRISGRERHARRRSPPLRCARRRRRGACRAQAPSSGAP